MTTTWVSVSMPELHEEGYTKTLSSFEKHRNCIQTFRNDISWSSLYQAQEQAFMSIADDKDASKSDGVYKMVKKEKELLDNFNYSMNAGLLLNVGNVDAQGRATISDPDTGRKLMITEGVIPQVEAFASKYVYSGKFKRQILNLILSNMAEKSEKLTGNHYSILCTQKLWNDIQETLGEYLANFRTDGTYMYSKNANKGDGGYVKVGATFNTYEIAGKKIAA